MTGDIEISLFDLLDEASKLLKVNKAVEEMEQRTLNFHKIQYNIENFLENFFLQFFNNGFELDIEGINEEALSEIEDYCSQHEAKELPNNTISVFKDVKEVVEDIENAVYFDPPKDDDLYKAFLTFLPKLFDSLNKDETVLRARIENYGSVRVRMEGTLLEIAKLKAQRRLT